MKIQEIFQDVKRNKAIKNNIIRDIRILFKEEEEDHYKLVRLGNFYTNICVEYEKNGDKNKTLPIKKYLDEIKPYLKRQQ